MFHSQFGQDEFLDTHVFEGKRGGVFLEVGAHDGLEISNTLFFERERGWTGLCVEADPLPYEKLKVNRPAVRSYNFAAGENEGTMPFIQVHGTERMHSGPASTARLYDLDKHLKKMNGSRRTIDVPVRRLTDLLRESGVDEIHYISMDIEGGEPAALRGMDFNAVMIHVLTIEFRSPSSLAEVSGLVAPYFEVVGAIDGGDVLAINRASPFIKAAPVAARLLAERAKVKADARLEAAQRRRAARNPLAWLRRIMPA